MGPYTQLVLNQLVHQNVWCDGAADSPVVSNSDDGLVQANAKTNSASWPSGGVQ